MPIISTASLRCRILAALSIAFTSIAAAEMRFEDVTSTAGIADTGESVGAAWADVNGDGFPDIWLDKHQFTPTVVYRNRGDGTFVEFIEGSDEPWGILDVFEERTDSHGRAWADFDNDGDDDVLEVSDLTWENLFWVNDGLGAFKDQMSELGFEYPFDSSICTQAGNCNPFGRRMPLWLDYDRDGDLDVMITAIVDYDEPFSPTAVFEQTVSSGGAPLFRYAEETGVNYAASAFCRYAVMAELSGDDSLDVICADQGSVTRVWDTSQLPFRDLESQIGGVLFSTGISDLAVGDFDGDLRDDLFGVRASFGQTVVDQVGQRTLHARFNAAPGTSAALSFRAEGGLRIDFDWATRVDSVFIGSDGVNPPASADISAYNGWRNRVQLDLSPADVANHGIATSTGGGVYIGFVDGRWIIRFETDQSSSEVQIVVEADGTISDLIADQPFAVGQPANRRPVLFTPDQAGVLTDASSKISGPQSSCASAVAGDFDNDGDLDVFAGCSGIVANLDNILYENDGLGNFTAITGDLLGDARGDIYGRTDAVLTADYDHDGRLDLFVTNGQPFRPFSYAARQQLFKNVTANGNHWIELDLDGVASNRDGIGARVFAYTPDGKTQLREQGNGMHRDAQNFRRIHFGLGTNTTVNLEVHWPSGVVDNFNGLAVDQIHDLAEGTGGSIGYVLRVGNVSVNESARAAPSTVTLSPAPRPGESVVVSYQTQNGSARAGSDYTAVSGTLTFTEGQTKKAVWVPITDDAVAESSESFTLNVSSADSNSVTASVTILDDDSGGALPRQKVYTVSPCRVVDTRGADPQLSTFSGDRLAPGETVSFFVTANLINGQGGAGNCGIPPEATGVFANVVAVLPQGSATSNYLALYPSGGSRPLSSAINYSADITAVANGVLVPLCDPAAATCDYDLDVYNHTSLAVHLVIDVTGYLAVPAP